MALAFLLSPMLVVAFGGMLLMLAEAFSAPGRRGGLALGCAMVFAAGLAFSIGLWLYGVEDMPESAQLAPWLVIDRFSIFLDGVFCLGGMLSALLAGGYLPEHRLERGEFYMLLLFSTVGAMMLGASGDALTVFLGLETMSIGAYALAAFRRTSPRSAEGALKYFLLGAFAMALMLYGFALLYGATGHTDLAGIGDAVRRGTDHSSFIVVALVLLLVGLLFKVSAVPFHMWTPDAYEGAPTPATTYMATVVKAGGFAMLLRVVLTCFGDKVSESWATGWPPIVMWLAVITMTVANLIAGQQESVKRMLAYSSIAHAGYILVGLVACAHSPTAGVSGVLFYLLTYTVSTAGAFGALILCGSRGKEAVTFEDLAGVGRRNPAAGLAFSLFLVSLAGIPPTAGFFGKWFIFRGAIEAGYTTVTVIAFLNSVLSVYYYLRVMVFLFMREPAAGAPVAVPMKSLYVSSAILISAILVLLLGIVPNQSLDMAIKAASIFGG